MNWSKSEGTYYLQPHPLVGGRYKVQRYVRLARLSSLTKEVGGQVRLPIIDAYLRRSRKGQSMGRLRP